MRQKISRRTFLEKSAATSVAAVAISTIGVPVVVTASRTNNEIITGEGEYQFRVTHNWPQLPDKYHWQTTHNVTVDNAGNLYVIHEGRANLKEHPSIFVFDPSGKFVKAFGAMFQGGGHGLEVHDEDGTEYLYVTGYQQVKSIAKFDLNGDIVWLRRAPMESGAYAEGEHLRTKREWGRQHFLPTNFAFLPDGDILLADGYGSFLIHRYDRNGNWKSAMGGSGDGKGKFNLCHGLWVDQRGGREPELIVTDRSHNSVQFLKLDGTHLRTQFDYGLPANIDIHENLVLIPELAARVTLLDENNEVVARLGDDSERLLADKKKTIRKDPSQWIDGKFVHPHDACFDANGNIFVAEWVQSGRVTFLERV